MSAQPAGGSAEAQRPQHTTVVETRTRRHVSAKQILGLIALAVVLGVFWAAWYASGVAIGPHVAWKRQRVNPTAFGIVPDDIWYTSPDGTPIQAWWVQPRDGASQKGTIVIAHGWLGNRADELPVMRFLLDEGYNVIAPDLRAHGASGGWYMTSGHKEALDIIGAIQFARALGIAGPFGAFGYSYGADATLYAAAQSGDIKAVACDSAFLSGRELLGRISNQVLGEPGDMPQQYRKRLWLAGQPGLNTLAFAIYRMRTGVPFEDGDLLEAASRIRTAHVLLLTAYQNPYAPLEDSKRILASVASPDKELVVELGAANFTTGGNPQRYLNTLGAFFDEAMRQPLATGVKTDSRGSL